jgi:hypothetical protein
MTLIKVPSSRFFVGIDIILMTKQQALPLLVTITIMNNFSLFQLCALLIGLFPQRQDLGYDDFDLEGFCGVNSQRLRYLPSFLSTRKGSTPVRSVALPPSGFTGRSPASIAQDVCR